jgi:hypothetical protein
VVRTYVLLCTLLSDHVGNEYILDVVNVEVSPCLFKYSDPKQVMNLVSIVNTILKPWKDI